MKRIVFILFILISFVSQAQDLNAFEKHWLYKGNDTLPYRVLLPKNYDAAKKYPLVLFLHGSGERGNDNDLQLTHGAKMWLADSVREKYPAIVVFPQCSLNSFWSNIKWEEPKDGKRVFNFPENAPPTTSMQLVLSLLDELEAKYKIKKDQRYVSGLSMGGMGTFELVSRRPKYFAAAIAICGGNNPLLAKKMKQTKWRIFHGAKDNVVPWQLSEQMVNALNKANASVLFKLYPDANHNSWDPAFAEPDYFSWLFSKRK